MAKQAPTRPTFGTLNEHLVCTLCKGYFVDATTVIECLHSFCRSCIVQYLQASTVCPRPSCQVQLHKGSPLRSLKPDKTLQDIVYKLVPNLFHNEMHRRRVYYDAHPQYADQTTPEQRGDCLERFYSPDDSISLSLEYHDRRKPLAAGQTNSADKKVLPPKRYLKCPALFTVGLLKKFIRTKFDLPPEITIDIFQRRESLADEYTLLDIAYIYPWKRSEPMKFFYRIRDPRVLEIDDEVEREMPALSAAVSGRATRASRRASSASSLASPMASPRGSPVPGGKKIKLEPCDKDARVSLPSPETPQPPTKLTSLPPVGAQAIQPKPVAKTVNGLNSPVHISPPKSNPLSPNAIGSPALSPTSSGPKITLTISPSRGTVTSSTTELPKLDPVPAVKSPPPNALSIKPLIPVQKNSPHTVPIKNITSSASKMSFAATVTTRTANGGFVTVKNPSARSPNGVTVGKNGPVLKPVGSTPLAASAVKPAEPVASLNKPRNTFSKNTPKTKRLSNGLPVLAPKTDLKIMSPTIAIQKLDFKAHQLPVKHTSCSTTVSPTNGRQQIFTATAPNSNHNSAPPTTVKPSAPSPSMKATVNSKTQQAEKNAEDEKKVETAKAILQLSMGFKRCNTPPDTTLHSRIDKIVKDLQDEDSGDHLVIKSEPASPAPTPDPSPRNSPVPRDPISNLGKSDKENHSMTPTLPKVDGLTITPIDPPKRKSTSSPNIDEKRQKLSHPVVAALKRNADPSSLPPASSKLAKVDKIAESILLRQQEKQLTETSKRPSPQPQHQQKPTNSQVMASPQQNVQKSQESQQVQGKTSSDSALTTEKPSQTQSPQQQTTGATSPPALKPIPQVQSQQPQPTKPVPQLQTMKPHQTYSARPSTNQSKTTATSKPQQTGTQHPKTVAKPTAAQQQLKPIAAQQQPKPIAVQQQSKPAAAQQQSKPAAAQQQPKQRPVQQQPKSTAVQQQPKPAAIPQAADAQQQSELGDAQQQIKAADAQQQPKPTAGQQTAAAQQQTKPAAIQQQPKSTPAQQHPKPALVQQQAPKPVTQMSCSPQQQANTKLASPESPVKNKKPIPDLQRLQKPPSSLSGTTVNGSLSLAEVKEHLAKKGQYSPPPSGQQRTPPKLVDLPQRKPAPPGPTHRDGYGALDLSSASPRADHGGSWTPPPSFAQTLVKRQHLLAPQAHRPPPSSLSSSSPSPPADSPGSSVSPELYLDQQNVLFQQQALIQQLQNFSMYQAQHVGLSPGLKKAIEDRDRLPVKAIAMPRRK